MYSCKEAVYTLRDIKNVYKKEEGEVEEGVKYRGRRRTK